MIPSARAAVMSAMPVSGGHVTVGAITHFALSAILGLTLAMLIIGVGIRMLSIAALRTRRESSPRASPAVHWCMSSIAG